MIVIVVVGDVLTKQKNYREMDTFDLREYLQNNPLLQEETVNKSEIEKLIAKAVGKSEDEIDIDKLKQEKEIKEDLTTAAIVAAPIILDLVGKGVNLVYRKIGMNDAKVKEYKALKQEIINLKKKHNIGKLTDNPLNDTPEQKKAKKEIKEIKKEINEKYSTILGDGLKDMSKALHTLYVSPILLFLWGLSKFTPKGNKLRDEHFRHLIANVLYAAFMIWFAGAGIVKTLGHLEGVKEVATIIIELVEEGASIAEVSEAALLAIGATKELNTK